MDQVPVATNDNGLPIIVACRGYKYIKDGNFTVQPQLSESVIRIINFTGGDCFHKFDKEGHPVLIDRTVSELVMTIKKQKDLFIKGIS